VTASNAGTGGKGAPGRGVFGKSRGTNTASSQTLPVSIHGYCSIGHYKYFLLFKPSEKVDTIPTSLVGNSELFFSVFFHLRNTTKVSEKGVQGVVFMRKRCVRPVFLLSGGVGRRYRSKRWRFAPDSPRLPACCGHWLCRSTVFFHSSGGLTQGMPPANLFPFKPFLGSGML
jgi:hypothetical protein